MSVSSLATPPNHRSALAKFWIAILVLAAVGIGIAWLTAGSLRGETTTSGLVFRTVQPGSGPLVTLNDAVLIDYEGRLPDGTVFDSSAAHGGPQAMAPAQTIPGFAEALTRMRKDGRYHVKIPSKLAYGPVAQGQIPANSDLEFDIHVVDVAPNAAAMAAQGPPQQQQQQQQQQQPQPRPQAQPPRP